MNPYWGANFFEVFIILLRRVGEWVSGHGASLAADELQMATLAAIAVSCGLIGPFLVLKRMSMLANSLSHTILLGVALAALAASSLWGGNFYDLSTLLVGAFLAACITSLLTEALSRIFGLQEDASVGLVFTSLFALGIAVVTLFTRDAHLGTEAVIGSADALQFSDLKLAVFLLTSNLAIVLLFFRQFQLASFDVFFAKTMGQRTSWFHLLLLLLTAVTCVGAFRAVGVLLVLAFLVGPYLIARLFCHRLPWLLFWSSAIGVFASLTGVAFARHLLSVWDLPLSTGGLVAAWIGILYGLALLIKTNPFSQVVESANLKRNS